MSAAAAPAAEAPKKPGKMKGILMMLVVALLFAGIGVGAGLYAAGAGLVGGHEKAPEDPNAPKLVAKEGAEEGGHGDKKTLPMDGIESDKSPDPTKYKATFFTFEQPFTSNLRDSDGFSQVGLGVSTFYDQKVLDNLKDNEMPIRSAILMVMSQQDSFTISTPEGKLKLQKDLKTAINDVLRQRTGFGGIDNVYFTSMVVQ
ncbi:MULTISPECIES: flagellar basal body-associated FliL family protein [unclassified Sphingomonas]|uniref:flagellar basal body-associated FliL family protein n=1 Tax=unclassified Sphingomonas TaxID=196159 RepID=UPI0006FFD333|nr:MULTISPECIES: flagellar basal body-associated FliL family protein [unclassified Sphingomonas]KQX26137.1 flagellar basal body protein FliL [Sphingomonas sp. Root1294]KQY69204.1 flagellar basal body protein FliL [Sphingomonas sp. Root50]KRB89459.1 flagellar basal body protein FliL [Sphingomonas sp. Root720]